MLEVKRIDIIEVGSDKPFKVIYRDQEDGELMMSMFCKSDNLKLLNDDGGYNHFHIDNRGMEEVEPEKFAYVVRVRKFRPPWNIDT